MLGIQLGFSAGDWDVWIDDIEYEKLGSSVIGTPVPALAANTLTVQVGKTVTVSGTSAVFPVNGSNVTLNPVGIDFFDYTASAPNYATVGANTGMTDRISIRWLLGSPGRMETPRT